MEAKTKDELLEQLSLAIEQIQKQFAQGGNVIKDCQETFFLCLCVRNILYHGLKEGLISWAMEATIWPLLEKITFSKDIEEIQMLGLKTDKEKCNAWIKMAVNENLLGSYIATLNQDNSLVSHHYYDFAFLRDPVMADTTKSLLNYGITNYDFEISISRSYSPNQSDQMSESQERRDSYDSFKQTEENGFTKTEPGLIRPQNASKKKRKRKKRVVAVIADQDDGNAENLGIVKSENCERKNDDSSKKEDTFKQIHEDDKLLNNTNDIHDSNTEELSSITANQKTPSDVSLSISHATTASSDSQVDEAKELSLAKDVSSPGNHVVTSANDSNVDTAEDQSDPGDVSSSVSHGTKSANDAEVDTASDQSAVIDVSSAIGHMTSSDDDSKTDRPEDQSDVSIESDDEKAKTAFATNELDQYLLHTKSQETNKEYDSLGRISDRPSSRQEFSINDFLLDETEEQTTDPTPSKQNTAGVSSVVTTASVTNENFTNFEENCETSNSGKEDLHSKDLEGIVDNDCDDVEAFVEIYAISAPSVSRPRETLSKERGDTNENLSGSAIDRFLDRISSSLKSEKIRKFSPDSATDVEVLKRHDYRVRKIETPEFVPSSYGSSSALSDVTNEEHDLNFVPGIHRISSRSFSSSLDRKSTMDNSLSFDDNGLPFFESGHYTESSSQPSSVGDSKLANDSNEYEMFEDLLNVDEEHFSKPDNFAGLTTSEELELAIEHYKKMIKIREEKSQQRDDLVQKLVKLRLRLQQERDGPPVNENPNCRKILSHQLNKIESPPNAKYFCDQCGKNIWTMWQSLFTCKDCGYHSHRKCLNHIQRSCPVKNLSSVAYILEICPDVGLDAQQYRCAECRKEITFSKVDVSVAKICDYTGQYFCGNCHWGDQMVIPARVFRNWDFSLYKVCRKTKQLLDLMKTRPILNLLEINPTLYQYVEELREIVKLREEILIMKKYFLTCREALESKLLMQLQKRQHFVDSVDIFSFQDILDLNNEVLIPEISRVHALFLAHIKADCELCRARGFICEVCQDSSDVIFAFDSHAIKCENCSGVFHKVCFKRANCPKCQRKKKIAEQT